MQSAMFLVVPENGQRFLVGSIEVNSHPIRWQSGHSPLSTPRIYLPPGDAPLIIYLYFMFVAKFPLGAILSALSKSH